MCRNTGISAIALVCLTTQLAHAQESSSAATAKEDKLEEVVVTGTLIRGIAPVGTNVIGVSKDAIVATGAASTNELLTTIPQIANFNSYPTGSANFGQPIIRPNLRNLGASGGNTTLSLLNGHRLVGSGILQNYADVSVIPPGVIERVEVIPDGGSSIYGSDAIGGVINFITRKRFSGIEANAKYGTTDGYDSADGSVTAGKEWDGGSFSGSYSYAWHNEIQGFERDYVTQDHRPTGGPDQRSVTCALPNIAIAGVSYALPAKAAGTQNKCNSTDFASIYPRERRQSAFVTYDQDLGGAATANVTAYYSVRDTTTLTAPLSTNSTITAANPFFTPIGAETSQGVQFDYTPAFGAAGTKSPARFTSWGITPSSEIKIGDTWNLNALINYGRSTNETTERTINADAANAALRATTTATALNPYNVAATNPAVLATIRDYTNFSEADQELAEARAVLDGSLFALPGGDVRLAVGAEYHYENEDAHIAFGPSTGPKENRVSASRNVRSIYGEIFVPVVGGANSMTGIDALDLTASVRHDDYSDVGGTTNPKVGFNYRPVSWVTLRGNYGTSFHAPALEDTTGAVDERVTFIPITLNLAPGSAPGDVLRPILFISGGSPTLKPETADTWSLGFDLKPEFAPGLQASLTYYNIDFTDVISVNINGLLGGPSFYADPTNAPFYIRNPTLQQAIDYSRGARADNFTSLQAFFAANNPYAIYDLRRYNRGRLKQDGLDFNINYVQPTGFGSVNATFAGTYTLSRETDDAKTNNWVDRLKNGVNRFNYVAALGSSVGPVTGRASLTHSGAYPILGDPTQARVAAFDTLDLFFSLDLDKLGWLRQSSLTLNVDNALDKDPPNLNSGSGYTNGSTLGRLISVGVRTSF